MSTTAVLPTTKVLAETTKMLKPPVTILDDYGHVDKELVRIHKGEEIEWINGAEHEVRIVFDQGPPFDWKESFVLGPKTARSSDRPKDDVLQGHPYKYTVIGSKGNNDPVVIIDP